MKIPVKIYYDDQGIIALASNNKFHAHTKHINIQYHFIQALVRNETLSLQYKCMDENIADIFMKAFLALAHLQELREKLEVSCA